MQASQEVSLYPTEKELCVQWTAVLYIKENGKKVCVDVLGSKQGRSLREKKLGPL